MNVREDGVVNPIVSAHHAPGKQWFVGFSISGFHPSAGGRQPQFFLSDHGHDSLEAARAASKSLNESRDFPLTTCVYRRDETKSLTKEEG